MHLNLRKSAGHNMGVTGPIASEGMPPKITDENVETPREVSIQRAIVVMDQDGGREDHTQENEMRPN